MNRLPWIIAGVFLSFASSWLGLVVYPFLALGHMQPVPDEDTGGSFPPGMSGLAVAGQRYRLEAPPPLPGTPISPELRHNVFLASKEAITNVVRHAQAKSVSLRLRLEPASFTLEIEDDGLGLGGLDPKAAQTRNGLRNMRKRMEDIGGSFFMGPASERGTVIRLTAPLPAQAS